MNDQMLHHFMEDLMPIVVLPVMFAAMAWVLGKIVGAFKHRAQLKAQTDFHNRLMEKFGTGAEFTAYLQSDAGKNFFEQMSVELISPLNKILNSIRTGVVLTLFGLGILTISNIFGTSDSRSIMLIVATAATTTGIGFLVSSAISYRLAKVWGLINASKKSSVVAAETPAPTA